MTPNAPAMPSDPIGQRAGRAARGRLRRTRCSYRRGRHSSARGSQAAVARGADAEVVVGCGERGRAGRVRRSSASHAPVPSVDAAVDDDDFDLMISGRSRARRSAVRSEALRIISTRQDDGEVDFIGLGRARTGRRSRNGASELSGGCDCSARAPGRAACLGESKPCSTIRSRTASASAKAPLARNSSRFATSARTGSGTIGLIRQEAEAEHVVEASEQPRAQAGGASDRGPAPRQRPARAGHRGRPRSHPRRARSQASPFAVLLVC